MSVSPGRFLTVVLAASVMGSCSDSSTTPTADAGPDITTGMDVTEPTCTREFTLDEGNPTGHAEPLGAAAGQARAGRLATGQIPTDRTGLGLARAGDFVLANSRVAVMIEDAGPSDLYDPFGGKILGIARVREGRMLDAADYNEAIFALGRYTLETSRVAVLRDGSAGGPAIVRSIGMLRPIPFIKDFARVLVPGEYDDIRAAYDYELAPDADHVDIYGTFDVRRPYDVTINTVLHAFFQHYRMPRFAPGVGFEVSMAAGTIPHIAFVDDGGTSYAWSSPDSALTPFLSVSGFDAFRSDGFRLPACAQTRRHLARVVVGSGVGLDGVVKAVGRVTSATLREVRGTVQGADGMPAEGVRVHATDAAGTRYYTRATTDAAGAFAVSVPADAAVRLTPWRQGDPRAEPVMVAADATTATIRLAPSGLIRVTATEQGSTTALPVRVQVFPAAGEPPTLPALFGERQPGRGRLHVAFPTTGDVTLRAPVGRWRVVVSRGFEYEISDTTVSVTAGETTAVPVSLRRSVETTGVQCGDFHIHTHRSPDASDDVRLKLAAIVGEGLEVPARSEHEFVADFEPLIAEMGVGRWAYGIGSIELTTFTWGHFGVVPLQANSGMVNNGSFTWVDRQPPQVFDEARARPGNPTIIINHPRGAAAGAYFTAAGYDPATGTASRGAAFWDTRFSAVEFFNDSSFEENRNGTVRDWFSFLDHGRRVFAVGSSDSHSINPNSPVGYPRTCMFVGTDEPRMLNPTMIRDAVAQGRSTISGGIYVLATAGTAGPGQEARGVGAMASVRVNVQAPTWVEAARLEVIVDGTTRQTIPLDASTRDPANPVVRFNRDVSVPVATQGSYVVFVVHGGRDLAPVYPGKQAFGVTNPIFLQR